MLLLQCGFTEMNCIETIHVDAGIMKSAPQKNVIYLVRQLSVFIQPFLKQRWYLKGHIKL